jgi:hypothetical protein
MCVDICTGEGAQEYEVGVGGVRVVEELGGLLRFGEV